MKKFIFALLCSTLFAASSWSQALNLAQLPGPSGHLVSLGLGYDHAFTAQVGYHHQLKTTGPLLLGAVFTLPAGNVLLDDWQLKVGGQYGLLQSGNLHLTAKAQLLARTRNSDYARHFGLGTDLAVITGWYQVRYFVAAEVGYDRTWLSRLQHGPGHLENYPGAVSGWYRGNASNVYLGLQGGYSRERWDLTLRLGRTFRPQASPNLLPFYALIGFNFRL